MKVRVITAIFILAIAIPIVIFSQYIVYPIALSLLSALAVFEMLRVINLHKCLRVSIPAYLIALAMPIGSFFVGAEYRMLYLLLLFVILFAYLIYIMAMAVFSKGKITVAKIGVAYLSISYVVASFASLSSIRYLDAGMYNLMLVFFISWGCDTSAYFFGTFLGKHKLIPEVSPKKSVEGAIGGIIGAIGLSLGFGALADYVFEIQTNYIAIAVVACVLAVVSQIGDLIASLIKREYGVKDYGKLMPGHGGVMDRFDSVLAVATPLLVVCMVWPPFGEAASLLIS